ncbi:MAG: hypothetical protein H6658_21295 [Ardenticatenaceae bacterium]|nr:hypothetical protein [Ardenticatenaceae bacterium]
MQKNESSATNSAYYAYMLRFWPEQTPGETTWRFTLLDPHSGQKQGFQSLDALFNHLASLTDCDEQTITSFVHRSSRDQQA